MQGPNRSSLPAPLVPAWVSPVLKAPRVPRWAHVGYFWRPALFRLRWSCSAVLQSQHSWPSCQDVLLLAEGTLEVPVPGPFPLCPSINIPAAP